MEEARKRGRPRKTEVMFSPVKFSEYRETIQHYKISFHDRIFEDDYKREVFIHFFHLEEWEQNLLIVNLIYNNKSKEAAEALKVDEREYRRVLTKIKHKLKKCDILT